MEPRTKMKQRNNKTTKNAITSEDESKEEEDKANKQKGRKNALISENDSEEEQANEEKQRNQEGKLQKKMIAAMKMMEVV